MNFIEALFDGDAGGIFGLALAFVLVFMPMRGCVQRVNDQEFERDKICLTKGGIPQHSSPYCYWSEIGSAK